MSNNLAIIQSTPPRQRVKATPYLPSYMEDGQLCIVCGDVATGLHYRAITCEGCKGFWRRTEQRRLAYVCKNSDQNCPIDKNNRNCCQRCRYNKCKAVGMSSDLVLNETERAQKRELIKENRERRVVEDVLTTLKAPHSNQQQKEMFSLIETVTRSYCSHIDLPISRPPDILSEKESYIELIRSLVRRVHSFSEGFEDIGKLNQMTQEFFLRASLLEIHVLKFVTLFDPATQCFHPSKDESIYLEDLENAIGESGTELVKTIFRIAQETHDLQMDLRQMAVLSAIFFFNPDNHPEGDSEATKFYRKLWDAFRHLCDEGYDSPDPKRWSQFLTNIMDLRRVSAQLEARLVDTTLLSFFHLLLTSKGG